MKLPRFIIIIVIALVLIYVFNKNTEKSYPADVNFVEQQKRLESLSTADLNGDGKKEKIAFEIDSKSEAKPFIKRITATTEDGKNFSTPDGMYFSEPYQNSFKNHRLNDKDKREFFSIDFLLGPHQYETMYFELRGENIFPICFTKKVEGPYDCLFYSAGPDSLITDDIDKNGLLEIIEVVDEYPKDAELTEEEKNAVLVAAEAQQLGDSREDMIRIAKREKGGLGKRVIWAIYSYDGKYFVPQKDINYDKYFSTLKKIDQTIVKKSEISQDSVEYNEFVRKFWSGRT